jgi:hypothetical protein
VPTQKGAQHDPQVFLVVDDQYSAHCAKKLHPLGSLRNAFGGKGETPCARLRLVWEQLLMLETSEDFQQRVGTVDLGERLDFRSRGQVRRDFVLALLLALGFVAASVWLSLPDVGAACIAIAVFAAYCSLAYFVRVRPNHDEMGAVGGLIDNPLRGSDGANRGLVQLALALAVGRFVSTGLVDGIRLLRRGQLPHERFLQNLEAVPPAAADPAMNPYAAPKAPADDDAS